MLFYHTCSPRKIDREFGHFKMVKLRGWIFISILIFNAQGVFPRCSGKLEYTKSNGTCGICKKCSSFAKINQGDIQEGCEKQWPSPILIYQCTQGEMPKCDSLTAPDHGKLVCTVGNDYKSVCHVACDYGYTVNNHTNSITCTEELKWNDTVPQCQKRTCPAIQAPKNSDLKCTVNITQPRCAVQCHEGFKIPSQHSSQDFATCLGNGTWDSPLPACVPKACPPVKVVEHGELFGNCTTNTTYNSKCAVKCSEGYKPTSETTLVCQLNEKWDHDTPKCVRKECPILAQAPQNMVLQCSDNNFQNSLCSVTCKKGFELRTNYSAIQCTASEAWSNPLPSCRAKEVAEKQAIGIAAAVPTGCGLFVIIIILVLIVWKHWKEYKRKKYKKVPLRESSSESSSTRSSTATVDSGKSAISYTGDDVIEVQKIDCTSPNTGGLDSSGYHLTANPPVIGDDRRPCEGPQQHEMEDISFLSEQSVQPRQFQLAQPYAGSGQDPVEDSYHSVERERVMDTLRDDSTLSLPAGQNRYNMSRGEGVGAEISGTNPANVVPSTNHLSGSLRLSAGPISQISQNHGASISPLTVSGNERMPDGASNISAVIVSAPQPRPLVHQVQPPQPRGPTANHPVDDTKLKLSLHATSHISASREQLDNLVELYRNDEIKEECMKESSNCTMTLAQLSNQQSFMQQLIITIEPYNDWKKLAAAFTDMEQKDIKYTDYKASRAPTENATQFVFDKIRTLHPDFKVSCLVKFFSLKTVGRVDILKFIQESKIHDNCPVCRKVIETTLNQNVTVTQNRTVHRMNTLKDV